MKKIFKCVYLDNLGYMCHEYVICNDISECLKVFKEGHEQSPKEIIQVTGEGETVIVI